MHRVSVSKKTGNNRLEEQPIPRKRVDGWTLAAFAALVFLVAANVIAVRFSNRELPPFFGAGTRFLAASLLFFLYVVVKRLPLPRGKALAGVLIYGLLQFAIGFALAYWSLQRVPAGLGSVILASVPLFTHIFAFAARIEPFHMRGFAGSLVAIGGMLVIYGERAGTEIPPVYLLTAVATSMIFALVAIVIKIFPPVHLAVSNGIGMLLGGLILLVLSIAVQEPKVLPSQTATWAAFLYLVIPGSVGLFGLLLFLLKRWSATSVSYQTVLSPLVAITLSAVLLDEPLTRGLFIGSALIIAGVYIGVLAPIRRR